MKECFTVLPIQNFIDALPCFTYVAVTVSFKSLTKSKYNVVIEISLSWSKSTRATSFKMGDIRCVRGVVDLSFYF